MRFNMDICGCWTNLGEDYLYPADFFLPLDLPRSTQRAVLMAG